MKKLTRILGGTLLLLMPLTFTSCSEADNPVKPSSSEQTEEETKPEAPTYASDLERPLTFKAIQDNVKVTLKFKSGATPNYKKVEYSLDKGATWTALKKRNQAIVLEKAGDIVMFRGENDTYNGDARFVTESAKSNARGGTRAPTMAEALIYGNITSMLRKDFSSVKELSQPYTFKEMFKESNINIDADMQLVLPAEDISKGCYEEMFAGNAALEVAPVLPAETLKDACYAGMFAECSKLKGITLAATSVEAGVKIEDCVGGILKGAGTDLGTGEIPKITFIEPKEASVPEAGAIVVSVEVIAGAMLATAGDPSDPDAAAQWSATVVNDEGEKVINPFETAIPVRAVNFDQENLSLEIGAAATLTAIITPKDAAVKSMTWTSEDPKVATVTADSDGKATVTAVAAGSTSIILTVIPVKKEALFADPICRVTVTEPVVNVTSVTLDKTTLELETGGMTTLKATIAPTDATDKTVTWSSDKESVATVDSNGKVTAVAPGEATITVTTKDGSKTATCKVTVTNPDPTIGPSTGYEEGGDPTK